MKLNIELLLNYPESTSSGISITSYTYAFTKDCPVCVLMGGADSYTSVELTSSTGSSTLLQSKTIGGYSTTSVGMYILQNMKTGDKVKFYGGKLTHLTIYSLGKAKEVLYTNIDTDNKLPSNKVYSEDTTITLSSPDKFNVVFSVTGMGEQDEMNHVIDTIPGTKGQHYFSHDGHDGTTVGAFAYGYVENVKAGDSLTYWYENKAWSMSGDYDLNNHSTLSFGLTLKGIEAKIGDIDIDSIYLGDTEIDTIYIGDKEL